MIFFKSLSAEDLADTMRANNPIRESAKIIRGLLLQENFDLQDKFRDAHDLKESWKNIVVPEQITIFLSALFNFEPKGKLSTQSGTDVDCESEDEEEDEVRQGISETKKRKNGCFVSNIVFYFA